MEGKGEGKARTEGKPYAFSVDAVPFAPNLEQIPIPGVTPIPQWGASPPQYMAEMGNPYATHYGMGAVMGGVPMMTTEREGLSVHAEPWSPVPELNPLENLVVDIVPPTWTTVDYLGVEVPAPMPIIVKKDDSISMFVHLFSVYPRNDRQVHIDLYNYQCARCPLKTLFGRISSRKADIILRNVSPDIPPLCIAHMIEQITKARITALCVNEADLAQFDVWLDKPNMSSAVVNALSGTLWTCPMFHGFAAYPKNAKAKALLEDYMAKLRDSLPADEGTPIYPLTFVEARSH